MDLLELQERASECKLCELWKGRNKPVFAKGNNKAKVVLCGMAPAVDENRVGLPFVGRAGEILDSILRDIGYGGDLYQDVYITNIVKCFLAAGKKLSSDWIDSCIAYFIVQMDLIKPKVVVPLGADVSNALIGTVNAPMWKMQGKTYRFESIPYVIMPTYHPSYFCRGGGVKHPKYVEAVRHIKNAIEFNGVG